MPIEIDGVICQIDKKLAPLIIELNKTGLKTKFCCEGSEKDRAYLAFDLSAIETVSFYGKTNLLCLYWELTHEDSGSKPT